MKFHFILSCLLFVCISPVANFISLGPEGLPCVRAFPRHGGLRNEQVEAYTIAHNSCSIHGSTFFSNFRPTNVRAAAFRYTRAVAAWIEMLVAMPRSDRPNTLVLGRFVAWQDRQERLLAKRRARRFVRFLYYSMKVVGVAACVYTSGLNATLVYMRPDFGGELLCPCSCGFV